LNLFNVFPTVPKALTFKYYKASVAPGNPLINITIPVGDYDGYALANVLDAANANPPIVSGAVGYVSWVYDPYTLKLKPLDSTGNPTDVVIYDAKDSWQVTGFDPSLGGTGTFSSSSPQLSASQVPINLTGVTQVQLNTTLAVANVPRSKKLCTVPMTVPYGSLLSYTDYQGGQPVTVMNDQIQNIDIELCDEHGIPLHSTYFPANVDPGSYEYTNFLPPWEVVLSIEEVVQENVVKKVHPQ
jgi:hypothetical protein